MSTKPLGGHRKVPHGWRLATLDEIKSTDVDACRAGPFGSSISRKYFTDSGIPVIRGNNLSTDLTEFIPSGFVFVSEERARQKYKNCIVRAGDLVFTCWGTIGQVGHIPRDGPFDEYVISNKQLKLRVDPTAANSKFVYYYLASKEGVEYLASRSIGGAVPGINLGILKSVQIALPPIRQQEDIVRTLSAYDDLIENNRRRIQLLEQAARLLYKEWFVHLRFPGHEHAKIQNGIPEGWEKKPLGELLTLQRGFDLPTSQRKDGPFPIYASTGINGYHIEAKAKGPGVVTGRSGSLGVVIFVSDDFWPLNTTLWVKEFKLIGPHFATHLLDNMQLEQYNGGAAVPTLNRNDAHRVEVLCPPPLLIQYSKITTRMSPSRLTY